MGITYLGRSPDSACRIARSWSAAARIRCIPVEPGLADSSLIASSFCLGVSRATSCGLNRSSNKRATGARRRRCSSRSATRRCSASAPEEDERPASFDATASSSARRSRRCATASPRQIRWISQAFCACSWVSLNARTNRRTNSDPRTGSSAENAISQAPSPASDNGVRPCDRPSL